MNKPPTTIWKFDLELTDSQTLQIPDGYHILSVKMQSGRVRLWAAVNPDNQSTDVVIRTFGTGHPLDGYEQMSFLGTVLLHNYAVVFHVFQELVFDDIANGPGPHEVE